VTGGDEAELRGDGLYEDHSIRYQTANENVAAIRAAKAGVVTPGRNATKNLRC
jgi:alkanesulfonate monooxygenase SsuD/methylene tetrahydromethanopterin reductase-like flavin-dependent oxidoreductase (luciferase family)